MSQCIDRFLRPETGLDAAPQPLENLANLVAFGLGKRSSAAREGTIPSNISASSLVKNSGISRPILWW